MDAYEFDFNKYIKSGPTFEEKVRLGNINDLGVYQEKECQYSPETAYIMVNEFKKFMVLNATLILLKEDVEVEKEEDEEGTIMETINGIKYYRTEIFPPFHIDRIWKLLILHSQTYFDF